MKKYKVVEQVTKDMTVEHGIFKTVDEAIEYIEDMREESEVKLYNLFIESVK